MSAEEIIEQIKALPSCDKAKVLDFVRSVSTGDKDIRYATPDEAKVAGDAVSEQFGSVFRRLAQ